MSRVASRFLVVAMATLLATGWLTARPGPVQAVSPNVVISQIYGAGGNVGPPPATYANDFVELFNRGNASQSLAGWSIQYASATGTGNFGSTATQITELPAVTLAPGQYFLVQEAGGANGAALPTPDFIDGTAIAMAAGAGKVALVNTTAPLACNGSVGQPCSAEALATIVDLIGYGNANFFEGAAAAPTLSTTTAALRLSAGCVDTDQNGSDFTALTPAPRNTSTALSPCDGGTTLSIDNVSQPEGDSGTGTMNFTVSLSSPAGDGGVTFDIATADDTATTADGDYIAQSLTGQAIASGATTYEFSAFVNGDEDVEPDETFFVNVTNVSGATVADGQGQGTLVNDDIGNPCEDPFTPIYDIQGDGPIAAMTGTVTTEGVVVGDFEGPTSGGLQGFYLQDAAGDIDPTTSDGIFVFTGNNIYDNAGTTIDVGDVVHVTGFARERFPNAITGQGLTSLTGAANQTTAVPAVDIHVCGTGSVTPTDVTMPFASLGYPERFEAMLVRFPQPLVIAEYFNYEFVGEIVIALPLDGESRPFTGTAIDEPGIGPNSPANLRTAANSLRRITLDDGLGVTNPTSVRHPNGNPFSLANRFRGGDRVANATGVLGFDFGLYRILPTAPADYTAVNPRPASPQDVGGRLTVSAMNTLNFFITADYPSGNPLDNDCGPANNLECRGWDNPADPVSDPIQDNEFVRQRTKLLQALAGLDADVLGLNELENSTGVDPLGDPVNGIVAGLNDPTIFGPGTYDSIDTGPIGTDAIKVGLIYKPAIVTPVGSYKLLTTAVDPRFIDTKSRPALAQTFQENATGERFTVVVNHLKSKGSACLDVDLDPGPGSDPDNDLLDGQANCSGTRTLAAKALVDWLATDPTGSGDPDFLIAGDLNSYAMEDPIDAIKAGPDDLANTADDYTNLIAKYQGKYAYSYTFDGQAGYLDHSLAGPTLVRQVTGAAEWHINSDEPDLLDYDVSNKPSTVDQIYEPNQYRTSDHDPVLVGLDLDAPPTFQFVAGGSCSTVANGGSFLVNVADLQTEPGSLSLSLTGNTNPTLVPNGNVSISGAATRTIAIAAADGESGTGTLTFSLGDGANTVTFDINVQIGTDADETLTGTAGSDLLVGYQGADSLSGLGGADVLCGGQGGDTLSGGDGADTLEGGQGADSLSGGEGNDVLRGGQGDDSLSGDGGDDTLTGNSGADSFSGGLGTDTNTDLTPSQGDTWDGT
jgi:predicted extracellular nuclease